jgi:hypothetical protein
MFCPAIDAFQAIAIWPLAANMAKLPELLRRPQK